MKAKKTRVTAQPKPISNEVATRQPTEEGLSIDPEDMGQSFLRYATEQGNYEGMRGEGAEELSPAGAPASDEAHEGTHFSAESTIWKNTVDMVVGSSDVDDVTNEAAPPLPEGDPLDAEVEHAYAPEGGTAEVDLTENAIDEASLLDEEADLLGEVVVKSPRTDDAPLDKPRRRR